MGHVVELHFHVTQSASQYEILLKKFVNTLSCEVGSEIQANENSLISIKILFRDKYLNIWNESSALLKSSNFRRKLAIQQSSSIALPPCLSPPSTASSSAHPCSPLRNRTKPPVLPRINAILKRFSQINFPGNFNSMKNPVVVYSCSWSVSKKQLWFLFLNSFLQTLQQMINKLAIWAKIVNGGGNRDVSWYLDFI